MKRIINFTNGKVRVTDPCYDLNVWCATTLDMLKGKYVMNTEVRDEGDWGKRIGYIKINHIDYKDIEPSCFECTVGVDSGQCGFFDYDYYAKYHKSHFVDDNEEDNDWYKRVCKITLDEPNYGIIDNMGCVSESGFGDGMYEVYVGYNDKDEIVSAMIVFIYDENEEDDEWEEMD